jgi:hypothetical protein
MAVDQYGDTFHGLTYPRRDLCARLGRKHADRMYRDTATGEAQHVGYVIAGRWLSVYRVEPLHAT